ncbi:LOW QUALITY PROTEIN: hypothetical protein Cgig2_021877 [Carnegiea gigantea]|uniref:F-box associated beta-propeller type 1 domain-containing protein n=1 Tax=Carnegiea gigantea TaxID=171969 RepID=A0A9Q1GXX8_9CARY|nr:LOW QUALITY PROTEIN: hypothetical protein Cgig2_021877 [Carnegiea gigantea]
MGRSGLTSRRSARNFSYLPLELWAEVLARLPEWKSLIENPNFASSHLNCYKNSSEFTHLLVIEQYQYELFASVCYAESFRRAHYVESLGRLLYNFRVEGCAGGLLLWKTFDSFEVSGFMVFNPSIRKSLQIPIPSPFTRSSWVGLAHDAVTNDYKVVFVAVEANSSSSCPSQPQPSRVPALVHIYSISSRNWKSSSLGAQFLHCPGYEYASIFLNGAIHWIGYDVSMVPNPSIGSHIVAFDLHKGVFNSFRLPTDGIMSTFSVLAVLGESLADFGCKLEHFTLSVMEQYGVAESWVKRFAFDLEFGRLLYLKMDGELFVTIKEQVKAYEIESGKIKDLPRSYRDKIEMLRLTNLAQAVDGVGTTLCFLLQQMGLFWAIVLYSQVIEEL